MPEVCAASAGSMPSAAAAAKRAALKAPHHAGAPSSASPLACRLSLNCV